MPAPEQTTRRRNPRGLLLAVLIPAALAAGIVVLVANGDDRGSASTASPAQLARDAEARDLGAAATRRVQSVNARDPAPIENGGPRPAPPARISIPAAGVRTVVDQVGLRGSAIRVPGIGRAGWWNGGPRPGEPGHAVIIGHLDTLRGPGLFARVPGLRRGQAIDVGDRDGRVHQFRVVGRAQVRKNRFPTDAVYRTSARPVLVLITCGGPYRQGSGYRDNVVVFARAWSPRPGR